MKPLSVITRTTTGIITVVVCVVALIFPLAYFVISYQYIAGGLETEAEITGNTVSQLISRDPEMWTYEQVRLRELLSLRPQKGYTVLRRVVDLQGRTIAENSRPPAPPLIMRSADLMDSGVVVGKMKVYRSLRPLFRHTGVVAVVGASVGLLMFLTLRVLPLQAMWRAAGELEKSEEKYRSLVEATEDSIFLVDRDSTYLFMNKNCLSRLGLADGAYAGRKYGEFHSPEATGDFIAKVDRAFLGGDSIRYEERSEKDGRYFLQTLSPVREPDGRVRAVSVLSKDITDLKQMQELIMQTEKMMAVGGLAAGTAHEINNPLNIIVQAAQVIERRVSADLPANRQTAEEVGIRLDLLRTYLEKRRIPEFIGNIRDAAGRAARIVSDMLQFGRRSAGTMKPVAPAKLMDEAVELAAGDYDLKQNYDFRNIEIRREYQPDVPEVPVIAVEMEQVLLNLVKNAVQAMKANPTERKPMITLRVRREGKRAVMEVEDNGPGMDEDVRKRIFEPFFTTKEPGMGTGLGLSVSYTIITVSHRGSISVDSSPGNGTRFTLGLPLEQGG